MTALPLSRSDVPVETVLAVPGMHCAGCIAKIEHGLADRPGIRSARVNLSARQVRIAHDPALDARDLVRELERIGFEAEPRKGALARTQSAARPLLAPLAVATFACMNVMLLSVSVWSGADGSTRALFHWLSAAIAIPAASTGRNSSREIGCSGSSTSCPSRARSAAFAFWQSSSHFFGSSEPRVSAT